MKKLAIVSPYLFEEHLIIALHVDWIKVFDEMPKFDVFINNGKLCIVSKEIVKNV